MAAAKGHGAEQQQQSRRWGRKRTQMVGCRRRCFLSHARRAHPPRSSRPAGAAAQRSRGRESIAGRTLDYEGDDVCEQGVHGGRVRIKVAGGKSAFPLSSFLPHTLAEWQAGCGAREADRPEQTMMDGRRKTSGANASERTSPGETAADAEPNHLTPLQTEIEEGRMETKVEKEGAPPSDRPTASESETLDRPRTIINCFWGHWRPMVPLAKAKALIQSRAEPRRTRSRARARGRLRLPASLALGRRVDSQTERERRSRHFVPILTVASHNC